MLKATARLAASTTLAINIAACATVYSLAFKRLFK